MRIVIDMQGAQTGSRFRGIGRYSLSLAKGIAKNRGEHQVVLFLSGLFPETIEVIRGEFSGLLQEKDIFVWHAVGPTMEIDVNNHWRREIAERMREACLAELFPDVVLITSLFEGLGDDAVSSIGLLASKIPTAVILYDLIPLLSPDNNFKNNVIHKGWYSRKIASLKCGDLLLAISESARHEALSALHFSDASVVNISGACDEFFCVQNISEGSKIECFRRIGVSKKFVFYTGGADERKNLRALIAAFACLPSKLRNKYQLVFAGKMPKGNVSEYKKVAKKNGLGAGDLLFTGYIDDRDLSILYNTCSLFVFPSLHEGFGLPPLEAMKCGAPVIASNATSLPEVIGLSEALFDPTSIDSIADKINFALTDEAFRVRLQEHAKIQIKKFSWDACAVKVILALERFSCCQVAEKPSLNSLENFAPVMGGDRDLMPAQGLLYNTDGVVGVLIESIAPFVSGQSQECVRDLARAIALNHPSYADVL